MFNRILDFANKQNVQSEKTENQFGFREKLSTYLALLKITNNITEELDKKVYQLKFSCTYPRHLISSTTVFYWKNLTIMVPEVQPSVGLKPI